MYWFFVLLLALPLAQGQIYENYTRAFPTREQSFEFSPEYVNSILVLLIPGIIVAFVSVVAGIAFCTCYGCCKRCGRVPVMLNKGKQFMGQRIVWGVVTPILIFAIVVMLSGDDRVGQGFVTLLSTLSDSANHVSGHVTNITQLIGQINEEYKDSLSSLQQGIASVATTTDRIESTGYDVEILRSTFVYFTFIFSITNIAVGVTGMVLRNSKLSLICGIISFISIAFIAVTFAIHLPTSILLDDVCYSIYNGLHGNQSPESFSNSINATDSGLRSILNNCFNTGSYFPGFENTFSFTSELLAALNDTSTQVLSYSFDPALTSDSNSLDDIITQTVAHIQGILIEINNRAANAPPSDGLTTLQNIVQKVVIMTQIFDHLYEILNCEFIRTTAQTLLDSVCQQFVVGSVIIFSTGAAILALFSVTCVIALYLAHKFKLSARDRVRERRLHPETFRVQAICTVEALNIFAFLVLMPVFELVSTVLQVLWLLIAIYGFICALKGNRWMVLSFAILETAIFVRAVIYIGLLGADFTFCVNNEDAEECKHYQTRSVLNLLFYTTDLLLSSLGTGFAWRLFYDLTCGFKKKRINFDNAYYELRDEERSVVFK
jgi:hypothetical protein